ncbi:hypothetical protein ACS0TY_019650 [Phlomoides rotata]
MFKEKPSNSVTNFRLFVVFLVQSEENDHETHSSYLQLLLLVHFSLSSIGFQSERRLYLFQNWRKRLFKGIFRGLTIGPAISI